MADVDTFWENLKQIIGGKTVTVDTPQGPMTYQQGGIPGKLASVVGGTANIPLVGPSADTEHTMEPVSVIHEQKGHNEGRGLGYDLVEALKGNASGPSFLETLRGNLAPFGTPTAYWKPSEVYAYTTQPANLSDRDMRTFGQTLMDQPDLESYYQKYRNPNSDWPATREEFAKRLGIVNSDEALARVLASRGQ